MSDKPVGVWSLVLVPAAITLVVSIVRLVGELQGWSEMLFNSSAPGAKEQQAGLVGIGWLIPVFGCWFGWKLRRATGGPEHAGKAALRFAIGGAVMVGGFFALSASGLVVMPTPEAPGQPSGLGYSLALVALAAIVMVTAWPRLATALVVYGVLARIPVIVITYIALQQGWQTHHTKLPPGNELPDGTSPFLFLALPQMTFWIVTTLLGGGLFGCLGAALARRGGK